MVRLIGAIAFAVSQIGLLATWLFLEESRLRTVGLVAAAIGSLSGVVLVLGAWRERKRSGGAQNTDN